jgi:L-alanine-DL-glutamate epimerase-like enolase superfamily enzyme
MKITDIEVTLLANPDLDPLACDSAQDAALVRVHTDAGLVGIGEVDATPHVVKAFLQAPSGHSFSMSMRDLLVGEDPRDVRRLWHKLYDATIMSARRGMGIHVLGAIDLALWDIFGKSVGLPIWKLLGGARQPHVTPYASILPKGRLGAEMLADTTRRMEQVRAEGFKAAKIEPVPEVTRHDDDVVEMVRRSREALGPDVVLMVDVGYRWRDAKTALRTIRRFEEYDVYFLETPIQIDLLEASAELAGRIEIAVACGELNAGRQEFVDLMDRGGVDIVQPDVPRAGGLTESLRVAEAAEDRGKLVVPHAWNTGITTASAVQLAAVSGNCPYIEYLPPSMYSAGLRKDLLASEPELVDGIIPLPEAPGLGVELDLDAVEHYRIDKVALT